MGKSAAELDILYAEHAGKYKILKDTLAADIDTLVAGMRAKREQISDTDVKEILAKGAEKAREVARKKMQTVRQKIGISL